MALVDVLAPHVFLYAPLVILVIFSFNDRELVSFPWEGFTLRWYQTFLDNPEILTRAAGQRRRWRP